MRFWQETNRVSIALPENPTVQFSSDGTGNITSMTERWPSGDVSTQTVNDGKHLRAPMVDASGKPSQNARYSHYGPDGSYSVDVAGGSAPLTNQVLPTWTAVRQSMPTTFRTGWALSTDAAPMERSRWRNITIQRAAWIRFHRRICYRHSRALARLLGLEGADLER